MDTNDGAESELAELVALVAAGRPEHLLEHAMAQVPAELRPRVLALHEAYARLALTLHPEAPPPALRERIMSSVRARPRRASRRAIVVLDMIHDHLDPGGPLEVPRARAIVAALEATIMRARAEGTPIVYAVDTHAPDDPDLDTWRAHAVKGSPGADVWPALAPEPNDLVVEKPTYSAFTRSTLADVLDQLEVDTLVLTGCLTEIGIQATAIDALQRGYLVEVPPDAQAGISHETELATLALLRAMPPYGKARADLLARTAK